jgi:serine/threonine-protein kinase
MVGDEPVPGCRLLEDLGGSAFYKLWKVQGPDGQTKLWKVIDLVVGNAAVETRTLGLLVQLRHPNLNTLTNFWQIDDGKTLIIESEVPVASLRDRLDQTLRSGSAIPVEDLNPWIQQAAEGLDFLNSPRHQWQGSQVAIYHRALRPECLLLFQEGGKQICKVSDFGLSKPVTEEAAQHSQGLLHYDYDPPEFFEGQTSSHSDQYALAINYYELRTGSLPFSGTMLQQLQARLNDAPDLHLLSEPERSIVKKALSREPKDRYENCQAFARQLIANSVPAAAKAAEPAPAPTVRRPMPQTPNRTPLPPRVSPPDPEVPHYVAASAMVGNGTGEAPSPTVKYNPPPTTAFEPADSGAGVSLSAAKAYRPSPSSAALRPVAAAPAAAMAPAPPANKVKDLTRTSLNELRHHQSGGAPAASFSADMGTGEQKIPMVWALAILAGVLGAVYFIVSMIPAG